MPKQNQCQNLLFSTHVSFFVSQSFSKFQGQIFYTNSLRSEETGAFSLPQEVLVLMLWLSFGFGVGVGSRVRIGSRFGVGSWVGSWVGSGIGIGIGRCRGGGNIAPSLVPLHVPHTSDGLDLRCSGSPIVPVLELSMLKHILASSVAWIHVSYPPSGGGERAVCYIIFKNVT